MNKVLDNHYSAFGLLIHSKFMFKYFIMGLLLMQPFQIFADNIISSTWNSKRSVHYSAYTTQQLRLAENIFEQLLLNKNAKQKISKKLDKQLNSLNLKVLITKKYFIISEFNEPYTGQGLYIINTSTVNSTLLQAPHAYHDLKTRQISIKLMQENNIKALAINTINRRYTSVNGELIYADMAHLNESMYMAFSRAFIRVFKGGKIIQLHGFNAKKYSYIKPLELILSNGTRAASQQLISEAECIDKALFINSDIYPEDIKLLGGTTNTIGRAARSYGFSGFKHIEMNLSVRKKILDSNKQRKAFSECIIQ